MEMITEDGDVLLLRINMQFFCVVADVVACEGSRFIRAVTGCCGLERLLMGLAQAFKARRRPIKADGDRHAAGEKR